MATGRRIIINHDNSGWRIWPTRRWGERHFDSDRRKGQRKMLNQKIRTHLKREAKIMIEHEQEEMEEPA